MASQTDMAGQGLGLPPQQPQGQSRAGQIGNMLGAFGAGIQGNLPQFQQVQQSQMEQRRLQQEQQQKLVQERQKTVFQDAQAALNLLENDNLDGVVQLGINRLQSLQNFPDANPEDTQRLTQLAVAARNGSEEAKERLKGELETTVEMGRSAGVLETPKRLSGSDLVEVEDPATGRTIYKTADEAVGMEAPQEQEKRDRVLVRKADGSTQSMETDNYGNYWDLEGNPVELNRNDTIIEGSTVSGTPDEFDLDSTQRRKLNTAEIGARNFIGSAKDAIEMLNESPDINTWVAKSASIVNDLQQEVKAIARASGEEFDESLMEPSKYEGDFDTLGIDQERMRGLVTSLAYQLANSREEGRLSDTDVRLAIREIGGSTADPRAFAQKLRDVTQRTQRNFKNTYKVLTGDDFEGDLGAGDLSDRQSGERESIIKQYVDSGLTQEEAEELYHLENQ